MIIELYRRSGKDRKFSIFSGAAEKRVVKSIIYAYSMQLFMRVEGTWIFMSKNDNVFMEIGNENK